jgi:Ca2+-binding RTX toxin-like protein
MTQVFSDIALDFRDFNLFDSLRFLSSEGFYDNRSFNFSSANIPDMVGSYTATDLKAYWGGSPFLQFASETVFMLGDNLSLNANGDPMAGTITGLTYSFVQNGVTVGVALLGTSVSASSVMAAANTASAADDLTLLKAMLAGNDRLNGSGEADYLFGANGNDTVLGSLGNDTVFGDNGNDSLDGDWGNDSIVGGAGNDSLYGDVGADRLRGGLGTDLIDCGIGTGADVIVYNSHLESANSSARDTIQSFTPGIDDINLRTIDANTLLTGNQNFAYSGTTATAHSVWISTSAGNTIVYADVTGDRTADFSVRLLGVTSLSSGDFVL